MEHTETRIIPYEEIYREQVIAVWERSARATHHFVSAEDFVYYKQVVCNIDFFSFAVYCLVQAERVIGILGMHDFKIEMLFIDTDFIGRGCGKQLMLFALHALKATKVDVNEQNSRAVDFYKSFGFAVYERTEKDDEGKAYPILKMALQAESVAGRRE